MQTSREECDDGNTKNLDGCSATCVVEDGFTCSAGGLSFPSVCEKCGNGRMRGREECDDGNARNGDGCSASCALEEGFVCVGGSENSTSTCMDLKAYEDTAEKNMNDQKAACAENDPPQGFLLT